jgi:hypothetical protein
MLLDYSFTPDTLMFEIKQLFAERDAYHDALGRVSMSDTLEEAQDIALNAIHHVGDRNA